MEATVPTRFIAPDLSRLPARRSKAPQARAARGDYLLTVNLNLPLRTIEVLPS
jgi:hypothetical protein